MINLPKYNPCEEYILQLKSALKSKIRTDKNIVIKYDKKTFFTNLNKKDLDNPIPVDLNENIEYISDGAITFRVSQAFLAQHMVLCPDVGRQFTGDIFLDGILKRMFSQLDFGFSKEYKGSEVPTEICHCIFKSIYTKSASIKLKNIMQSLDEYNKIQKQSTPCTSVIRGIIYTVYDYYINCRT